MQDAKDLIQRTSLSFQRLVQGPIEHGIPVGLALCCARYFDVLPGVIRGTFYPDLQGFFEMADENVRGTAWDVERRECIEVMRATFDDGNADPEPAEWQRGMTAVPILHSQYARGAKIVSCLGKLATTTLLYEIGAPALVQIAEGQVHGVKYKEDGAYQPARCGAFEVSIAVDGCVDSGKVMFDALRPFESTKDLAARLITAAGCTISCEPDLARWMIYGEKLKHICFILDPKSIQPGGGWEKDAMKAKGSGGVVHLRMCSAQEYGCRVMERAKEGGQCELRVHVVKNAFKTCLFGPEMERPSGVSVQRQPEQVVYPFDAFVRVEERFVMPGIQPCVLTQPVVNTYITAITFMILSGRDADGGGMGLTPTFAHIRNCIVMIGAALKDPGVHPKVSYNTSTGSENTYAATYMLDWLVNMGIIDVPNNPAICSADNESFFVGTEHWNPKKKNNGPTKRPHLLTRLAQTGARATVNPANATSALAADMVTLTSFFHAECIKNDYEVLKLVMAHWGDISPMGSTKTTVGHALETMYGSNGSREGSGCFLRVMGTQHFMDQLVMAVASIVDAELGGQITVDVISTCGSLLEFFANFMRDVKWNLGSLYSLYVDNRACQDLLAMTFYHFRHTSGEDISGYVDVFLSASGLSSKESSGATASKFGDEWEHDRDECSVWVAWGWPGVFFVRRSCMSLYCKPLEELGCREVAAFKDCGIMVQTADSHTNIPEIFRCVHNQSHPRVCETGIMRGDGVLPPWALCSEDTFKVLLEDTAREVWMEMFREAVCYNTKGCQSTHMRASALNVGSCHSGIVSFDAALSDVQLYPPSVLNPIFTDPRLSGAGPKAAQYVTGLHILLHLGVTEILGMDQRVVTTIWPMYDEFLDGVVFVVIFWVFAQISTKLPVVLRSDVVGLDKIDSMLKGGKESFVDMFCDSGKSWGFDESRPISDKCAMYKGPEHRVKSLKAGNSRSKVKIADIDGKKGGLINVIASIISAGVNESSSSRGRATYWNERGAYSALTRGFLCSASYLHTAAGIVGCERIMLPLVFGYPFANDVHKCHENLFKTTFIQSVVEKKRKQDLRIAAIQARNDQVVQEMDASTEHLNFMAGGCISNPGVITAVRANVKQLKETNRALQGALNETRTSQTALDILASTSADQPRMKRRKVD